MALRKIKQINSVLSADYWRIIGLSYFEDAKSIEVRLGIYISKASRDAGDGQIMSEKILIPNIEKDSPMSYEFAYEKLEAMDLGFETYQ